MRTTIRLPDDLLAAAKERALKRGVTLTQLFADALRENLAREQKTVAGQRPVKLSTVGGSGTHPGVDLDDTAALLEVMESGGRPSDG